MHQKFACFLLAMACLVGCKKSPPASDTSTTPAPTKPVAVDAAPAETPAPAPATAPTETPSDVPSDVTVNLTYLNQAIADFYSAEMRAPKDLNELVKGGYAKSLPQPPPGKKFVVDPKTRQVQVVNK